MRDLADRARVDEDTLRRAGWALIDPNAFGERVWKPPLGRRPLFLDRLHETEDRLAAVIDIANAYAEHRPGCGVMPCDCGLTAALDAANSRDDPAVRWYVLGWTVAGGSGPTRVPNDA